MEDTPRDMEITLDVDVFENISCLKHLDAPPLPRRAEFYVIPGLVLRRPFLNAYCMCPFDVNKASMEDWSFYGKDLPQTDNRRSNALERSGQTLQVEIEREKINQTIEEDGPQGGLRAHRTPAATLGGFPGHLQHASCVRAGA